jgi:predicted ATPase
MITALNLKNFKCFEKQPFEFSNLTLMTGLNGMGKSSVLQALLLLRQSKLDDLLDNVGLSLNGELLELGTNRDVFFEGAKHNEFGFDITFSSGQKGKWAFGYDQEADVAQMISDPVSSTVYQENLFTDSFQYLQAERIGPRKSFAMSEYKVGQHHQLGSRGEYTAHFLALNGTQNIHLSSLAHAEAVSLSLNHQVEAWMSEISPGIRLWPVPVPDLDLVNLRYSFILGKDTSSTYRPTNVGFGISYALHIVVALLASKPDDLILIENPEAHLHPHGQRRIGELLAMAAQAGVQIVLETHSDHILNGVRISAHDGAISPENIALYFLGRNDDGSAKVLSPHIDRNGRFDIWPEGFFDEWDKSLDKLLDSSEE